MRTAEEDYPLLAETAAWSGEPTVRNNQAIAESNAALREITEARFPLRAVGPQIREGARFRTTWANATLFYEVVTIRGDLTIHVEIQDADGAPVDVVHVNVSLLADAIAQGWLVAVDAPSADRRCTCIGDHISTRSWCPLNATAPSDGATS